MRNMQQVKNKTSQLGQTLIEVILATAIVASVLTAIAASVSMSSKNTNENKKKSMATSFAQETLEVFHRERYSLGWETFKNALGDGTYCFNDLPANSASFVVASSGECGASEMIPGTIFQREAVLTSTADQLQVESIVSWLDDSKEQRVNLKQVFKQID